MKGETKRELASVGRGWAGGVRHKLRKTRLKGRLDAELRDWWFTFLCLKTSDMGQASCDLLCGKSKVFEEKKEDFKVRDR